MSRVSGPKVNLVLDIEPIRPGEEECAAALRLLGRLRGIYGPRFLDGISADAWYAKGPFLRAIDKLGWLWIVVLNREDMEIYGEVLQLSRGQKPCAAFRDEQRDRQVQLWEVKDLRFSDGYTKNQPVIVVISDKRWTERRVVDGQKRVKPQQSQWICEALGAYLAEVIYQGGHRRWGIENKAFNELTQYYHLEHCYHHDPTSMLVRMLILIVGFALFSAFALHSQSVRSEELTLKALVLKRGTEGCVVSCGGGPDLTDGPARASANIFRPVCSESRRARNRGVIPFESCRADNNRIMLWVQGLEACAADAPAGFGGFPLGWRRRGRHLQRPIMVT